MLGQNVTLFTYTLPQVGKDFSHDQILASVPSDTQGHRIRGPLFSPTHNSGLSRRIRCCASLVPNDRCRHSSKVSRRESAK